MVRFAMSMNKVEEKKEETGAENSEIRVFPSSLCIYSVQIWAVGPLPTIFFFCLFKKKKKKRKRRRRRRKEGGGRRRRIFRVPEHSIHTIA